MMRFISLLRVRPIAGVAVMLVCVRIMGQPTITEADMPAPGLAWSIYELSNLPPIASGPNVTWDLTGVVVASTRQLQIEEPSTAPGAANFPSATAVAFADNGPPYNYIEVTESQMLTLGSMNSGPLIYSDPLATMVLPCTYGTTWTDTFAQPNAQGVRTYTADGHGTLVGPGGSFSDVLKVRTEYTSVDTMINGVHVEGLAVSDVFWRNNIGWPLVTSIWNRVYADGQLVQEIRGGSALAVLFTSIPEAPNAFAASSVWPNPSTGRFTLEFKDPLAAESYYSVYDVMGKLLCQRPLPTNTKLEEVDFLRFGTGTFAIKFTSPSGIGYERVVIE